MYHNYFGLKEPAFSIAVNPNYLYMSRQHKEALAHLLYGVKGGGFVMLSGEVGTGKTTIIRCLLEQLPDDTDIAIVLNPMAKVLEMLYTICDELGVSCIQDTPNIKDLTDALYTYLLNNHRKGRNTVLLIDEAQLLSEESLEQIRLLTNLETTTKKLLQIILVGQPEINDVLAKPSMRQLSQRITARFHLKPLTESETQSYIIHRLGVAGMPEGRNPFPPVIVKHIHRFTGGIPRLINIVCERSLIGAYGHNKVTVDKSIFEAAKLEVVGNVDQSRSPYATGYWKKAAALASTAAVFLALVVLYFLLAEQPKQKPQQAKAPEASNVAISENASTSAPIIRSTPTSTPPPDEKLISANTSDNATQSESYYIANFDEARLLLLSFLGQEIAHESKPCWSLIRYKISCEEQTLSTWDELSDLNRPAVLNITTASKFKSHVILIGLKDSTALLYTPDEKQVKVELADLGPYWTGEVFYIWQRPSGFKEPIGIGTSGQTVSWLAKTFAELDNQAKPLADRKYTKALAERVKIFQRTQRLSADGVVGKQTLLRLNDKLGLDSQLITEF